VSAIAHGSCSDIDSSGVTARCWAGWRIALSGIRASAGFPPVRAGPPKKKNVSRRDTKTQRRGAEQHAAAHRVLVFSLRLCVFARASHSSREDAEVDATMLKTTLSAAKQAVRRQASVNQAGRLRRDSASCGHRRIRAGTVAYGDRRPREPRGQRHRCVPITYPVPFDAMAADIQKRDNPQRHAVIWLVHVVVSIPRLSSHTHAGEFSENHTITSCYGLSPSNTKIQQTYPLKGVCC
jgi:hypothetical protein